VKEELNTTLDIEGILFTMYDGRTTLAQQVVQEVKGYFGQAVFQTLVPRNIRLSEAPSFGMPCILYDYQSRGSQAYLKLAREIDQRYVKKPELRKRPKRPHAMRAAAEARASRTS
jgi:chromosome partitioning protein